MCQVLGGKHCDLTKYVLSIIQELLGLTFFHAWTWWSPKKKKKVSTLLPVEICACTNCQRLFSSRRVQPNLSFSLVQVILALNLFENRITRTPSSSETEVSLYSFGVQNKLISFSLFLMFGFSNKSVLEQPSRANCVRQPRFDTCQQIITSKKHLDIFYSNLKKYLTSRLYNLTSRLLQKHLNLDENNLKWQLCEEVVSRNLNNNDSKRIVRS